MILVTQQQSEVDDHVCSSIHPKSFTPWDIHSGNHLLRNLPHVTCQILQSPGFHIHCTYRREIEYTRRIELSLTVCEIKEV